MTLTTFTKTTQSPLYPATTLTQQSPLHFKEGMQTGQSEVHSITTPLRLKTIVVLAV